MISLFRISFLLVFSLYWGGLTFYTGFVVRIAHDVLSDPMDGGLITQRVTVLLQVLGVVTLAASGILYGVAPWIIRVLYGEAYVGSVRPFQLLVVGALMLTIYKILNADLAGRGRPGVASMVFGGAFVLNLVLNAL